MGVPWLMEALTAVYGRAGMADRIPPVANLVVSNVPGSTVPLFMAGAKMLSNHPASIVVHGVALNITVQSYDESLDVGVMACARAMPEVAEFAAQIETAFEEFKGLPASAPAEAAAPPAKKAAAPRRKAAPAKKKSVSKATRTPRAAAPTAKRASR
jgi:hypothetical protein